MPNTSPCSSCKNYDAILRGTTPTRHGWCVAKSLYPYRDAPGQTSPAAAQRVASPSDPAVPHVVRADGVVPQCQDYQARSASKTKDELRAAAAGKKVR